MASKYEEHPMETNFKEWEKVQHHLSVRGQTAVANDRLQYYRGLESQLADAEKVVEALRTLLIMPESLTLQQTCDAIEGGVMEGKYSTKSFRDAINELRQIEESYRAKYPKV